MSQIENYTHKIVTDLKQEKSQVSTFIKAKRWQISQNPERKIIMFLLINYLLRG